MSGSKKYFYIILTLLLTTVLLGGSYALFSVTVSGTKDLTINAGTLSLTLEDEASAGISVKNGSPILEETALKEEGYTFTLTNTGTKDSNYTVYLDDMLLLDGETKLDNKYIRYNLQRDIGNINKTKLLSNLEESPNRALETGIIKAGEKYTYTLRLWIDYDADNNAMQKTFKGKIRIEATQTTEYLPNTLVRENDEYMMPTGYFWDYRSEITKIVFLSDGTPIDYPIYGIIPVQTWDLSVEKNKSIMGYLESIPVFTGGKEYTLYIKADGPIHANQDSSYLFSSFNVLTSIEGIENFDTSNVTDMTYMFGECRMLTNLDLSSFDTSNVTDMTHMFGGCGMLINLDVSSFDTLKVTNMSNMFLGCSNLVNLDLGSFNTSNVTSMAFSSPIYGGGMFAGCVSLKNLDISNFNMSKVPLNSSTMFSGCTSIETLKLNNVDFSLITDKRNLSLYSIPSTAIITVKDIASQEWIITRGGNKHTTANVIIA